MVILTTALSLSADEINNSSHLSPAAVAGIDYLIKQIGPEAPTGFDPGRLAAFVDFIAAAKPAAATCHLPRRFKATPAYYEFDIKRAFEDILQLAYHPDIPAQILSPASMRLCYWVHIDGAPLLPRLWKKARTLSEPVVIKGVEAEELTPDTFSGAYYSSLLDRVLILFSHRGHRLLISLSKQKKPSDVGKKGLIMGDDHQWDYFYSGEKGLTKTGLGWADSYIYDTFSILVYYETDHTPPQTRCSIFKWLRAGWMGLNMVREKHIQAGFRRYARDVRRIMESPRLPDARTLAKVSGKIKSLSDAGLKKKMALYLRQLVTRHTGQQKTPHPWVQSAAGNSDYMAGLSPPQMRAALFLEYLKYQLGLLAYKEVAYLAPLLQ